MPPRLLIVENPFARIPLSKDIFTADYDERWEFDKGKIKRTFVGSSLAEQDKRSPSF